MTPIQLETYNGESEWIAAAQNALRARLEEGTGHFSLALAGGTTPEPFYRSLATADWLAWEHMVLCVGDERCVPLDHPDRNERMIRAALGPNARAATFLGWGDVSDPAAAAERMDDALRTALGTRPRFDMVLLGLGDDGHTASLFPGTTALDEQERVAVAVRVPALDTTRLTLTLPILSYSGEALFLVRGKPAVVERLLRRDPEVVASHVGCSRQRILWLR